MIKIKHLRASSIEPESNPLVQLFAGFTPGRRCATSMR
jgi:hypothetical protein